MDIRFSREAERLLGDNVALNSERSAAQGERRLEHKAVVPDRIDVWEPTDVAAGKVDLSEAVLLVNGNTTGWAGAFKQTRSSGIVLCELHDALTVLI